MADHYEIQQGGETHQLQKCRFQGKETHCTIRIFFPPIFAHFFEVSLDFHEKKHQLVVRVFKLFLSIKIKLFQTKKFNICWILQVFLNKIEKWVLKACVFFRSFAEELWATFLTWKAGDGFFFGEKVEEEGIKSLIGCRWDWDCERVDDLVNYDRVLRSFLWRVSLGSRQKI